MLTSISFQTAILYGHYDPTTLTVRDYTRRNRTRRGGKDLMMETIDLLFYDEEPPPADIYVYILHGILH